MIVLSLNDRAGFDSLRKIACRRRTKLDASDDVGANVDDAVLVITEERVRHRRTIRRRAPRPVRSVQPMPGLGFTTAPFPRRAVPCPVRGELSV